MACFQHLDKNMRVQRNCAENIGLFGFKPNRMFCCQKEPKINGFCPL